MAWCWPARMRSIDLAAAQSAQLRARALALRHGVLVRIGVSGCVTCRCDGWPNRLVTFVGETHTPGMKVRVLWLGFVLGRSTCWGIVGVLIFVDNDG